MSNPPENRNADAPINADAIVANGDRVGIPVSADHAALAARWGDPNADATARVRSLYDRYQRFEPAAVFRPVPSPPRDS